MMALVAFGVVAAFGIWLTFTGESPEMVLRGVGMLIAGVFGLAVLRVSMVLLDLRNAVHRLGDIFETRDDG